MTTGFSEPLVRSEALRTQVHPRRRIEQFGLDCRQKVPESGMSADLESQNLEALIPADADARRLLDDSTTGIAEACATEVAHLLDTMEGV